MVYCRSIKILFFSFLLIQCKDRTKDTDIVLPTEVLNQYQRANKGITGKWSYGFPFYSSSLTIQENGIFKFYSRACMGQSYSEGNWYLNGDYLTLKSFDKYKEQINSEIIIDRTKTEYTSKTQIKEGNAEIGPIEVNRSVVLNFPDTSHTYFDHSMFRLMDNTLYEMDQYGTFNKTKYKREHSIFDQ